MHYYQKSTLYGIPNPALIDHQKTVFGLRNIGMTGVEIQFCNNMLIIEKALWRLAEIYIAWRGEDHFHSDFLP